MRTPPLAAGGSEIFRFGEFTFDCGSHQLQRDGLELHLSPKARQLLRILLTNRPKAISREEIYDTLWPSTFVCETNMASIISELRRAMGDDARSGQYIRTVHGFGYAFAGDAETLRHEARVAALLLVEGQRHPLYTGKNLIGRSHDCDVVLTGATVSRHHAVITIMGNTITIEDIGSRNGTYVGSKKVAQAQIHQESVAFGAVIAAISRKISSTMPFPMNIGEPRRHSSDSTAPS